MPLQVHTVVLPRVVYVGAPLALEIATQARKLKKPEKSILGLEQWRRAARRKNLRCGFKGGRVGLC